MLICSNYHYLTSAPTRTPLLTQKNLTSAQRSNLINLWHSLATIENAAAKKVTTTTNGRLPLSVNNLAGKVEMFAANVDYQMGLHSPQPTATPTKYDIGVERSGRQRERSRSRKNLIVTERKRNKFAKLAGSPKYPAITPAFGH